MFSDSDGLSGDTKRLLVRLAALYMAQHIAESAQVFAGRLRDNPGGVSAPDALMAFSLKVRGMGSGEIELLLANAPVGGILH